MKQMNGRSQKAEPGASPLEQILGKRIFSSTFFTTDIDKYKEWLTHQNINDLYKHQLDVLGEMTRGDRDKIVAKLEKAFIKYHNQTNSIKNAENSNSSFIPETKKNKALEILKRGI